MRRLWDEVRGLTRGAVFAMADYRISIVFAILTIGAFAFITVPNDPAWLDAVRAVRSPFLIRAAATFSVWGDFLRGTLMSVAAVFVVGLVLRRPQLRRAALASLLAASLAGGIAVTVRSLVGRPRPRSPLEDGMYGPSFEHKLNSFPSGHSATAFGTATALLPTVPVVGVPATVFAFGVAWSRMHRNYHHPTDVMVGSTLGTICGLAFGIAARRRNQSDVRR